MAMGLLVISVGICEKTLDPGSMTEAIAKDLEETLMRFISFPAAIQCLLNFTGN